MDKEGYIDLVPPKSKSIPKKQNPKKIEKTENQPFQCYACGEINSSKTFITNHILEKHFSKVTATMLGPPREHQCNDCHLMFSSNGALGLHECGKIPTNFEANYYDLSQWFFNFLMILPIYDIVKNHITPTISIF